MDSKKRHTAPGSENSIGRMTSVDPRPVDSDHLSQEAIASERITDRRSAKMRRKE
jgi:hypothetical protein